MTIEEALTDATGQAVRSSRRVGGGCINEGWRAELADGTRLFVKTRQDVPPGEYAIEAAALGWLAEPAAVRVPAVIAVRDDAHDGGPRLLALEWIDEGSLAPAGAEELGRDLAALHAAGASAIGAPPPGAPLPELRIGPITLANEPHGDWPSFYADERLRPLIGPARANGSLSERGAAAIESVCERIAELAGPAEAPARLHGDLWGGNVLAGADGRAWLIDPAAYGGHREVDLAMLRLFGSPGPRLFAAYEEAAPLAAGHADRVGLWQLFPLLVHAVLFGGGYGASVESTARRYC